MKKAGFILFLNMLGSFLAAQHVIKFNKIYSVLPGRPCFSDRIYECPGGYMIYGGTTDTNNLYRVVMQKIDTSGNLLWKKSYGKSGYDYYDESVVPEGGGVWVPWGGYIEPGSICTTLKPELQYLTLYRFDSKGDTIWTKVYKDSASESGITVNVTREKQYILGAEWLNYRGSGFVTTTLKKTDSLGNTIWQKTYHGVPGHFRSGLSLDTCKDGGYIYCSFDCDTSYGYDCGGRIFIMKTDSAGTPQWTKYISDPICLTVPTYILSLHDGSYLVCGNYVISIKSGGWPQYDKLYLVKITSNGAVKWAKQYGFGSWITAAPGLNSIKELSNGDIITCGEDSINILGCILKIDSNGNQKWLRYYNKLQNPSSGQQYLQDIQLTADGGYVAAGTSYGNAENIWVVKVDSLGCDTVGCDFTGITELKEENKQFNLYPNPANNTVTIKYNLNNVAQQVSLILYNVLGNKLRTWFLPTGGANNAVVNENISSLAQGIYFYTILIDNQVVQRNKLVITR